MSDEETLKVYNARAHDYAERLGSDPASNEALNRFIARLPAGGRVLDLGCGPGTWARQMIELGLTVDAIDASEGMVALASEIKGLSVRQATFEQIDAVALYDGIWANFSLLHAARQDMPGHLARLVRALKPAGLLHIGLKEGSGEQRDALGRLYSYYTAAEVTGLLAEHGLRVTDLHHGAGEGLDGTVAPWFTLTAHA